MTLAHNLGHGRGRRRRRDDRPAGPARCLGCEYGQGFYFSKPVDGSTPRLCSRSALRSNRREIPLAAPANRPTKRSRPRVDREEMRFVRPLTRRSCYFRRWTGPADERAGMRWTVADRSGGKAFSHAGDPQTREDCMAESAIPHGRRTQRAPAVEAMHILWITAGLGCDGDSIAITAATQPSLEDLVLGAIPGFPRSTSTTRCWPTRTATSSWRPGIAPRRASSDPFLLVVEGSIPDERDETEGYWAAVGVDRQTGQPITTCDVDRPPGPAGLGRGRGRHLRRLRRHPRHGGEPDRLHGPARLPGLGLAVEGGPADRLRAGLSGAAGQLHGSAAVPAQPGGGPGADDSAGRAPAAGLAVRPDRPRGLRPGRLLRAGRLRRGYGSRECIVKLGCWGPVVQCNVGKRGWMAGIGGCPNVGGVCIGCTMPGFPDKFMPFLEMPPGAQLSTTAVAMYGKAIRALRQFTRASMNREPEWRTRVTSRPDRQMHPQPSEPDRP